MENGISRLGIIGYGITAGVNKAGERTFIIQEACSGALPWGEDTADYIRHETCIALSKHDVGEFEAYWNETGNKDRKCAWLVIKDTVTVNPFSAVSDNASNVIGACAGFEGDGCVAHTEQLCVMEILSYADLKPAVDKVKGLAAHFHAWTTRM